MPVAFARTIIAAIALSIVPGYLYELIRHIWVTALLHASMIPVKEVHLVAMTGKSNEFIIEILWTGLWVIIAEIWLWLWTKSNGILETGLEF